MFSCKNRRKSCNNINWRDLCAGFCVNFTETYNANEMLTMRWLTFLGVFLFLLVGCLAASSDDEEFLGRVTGGCANICVIRCEFGVFTLIFNGCSHKMLLVVNVERKYRMCFIHNYVGNGVGLWKFTFSSQMDA